MHTIIKNKISLVFSLLLFTGTAIAQTSEGTPAQLRDLVHDMTSEVQYLEDTLAIQRLQRAYGYYIDKGYWVEAAALFADSATLEVGVDGIYRGKERVLQMLTRYGGGKPGTGPGLPFGQLNHHMQLQPVITLGADGLTAQARWRDFSLLGEYKVSAHWGDAIMENTYIKEDGIWKIQSLHLYPNFVAPYVGGWAVLPEIKDDWQSAAAKTIPADAPPSVRYPLFPAIYTPPFHYENAVAAPATNWSALISQATSTSAELADVHEVLQAYAKELSNLRVERDIENLQAVYGYYIDKGMWSQAAAMFSDTATYEFGQGGVYVGKGRIHQALGLMGPEGLEKGLLNNYSMLQPIISVAEDNLSAKARWRSDVQLSRDGKGTWGGGVYENEYINDNGVWKISKLHFYVTFWAEYDKGWIDGTLPMAGPSAELPPDRPPTEIYASQPEVYLFPFHYPHLVTRNAHRGKDEGANQTGSGQ